VNARLHGDGIPTTLVLKGDLTIGGTDIPEGCVPTPRFTGEACYLAPRQHPYTVSEIALHSPSRPEIVPRTFGVQCICGSRRTARSNEAPRLRICLDCHRSFVWRVLGGLVVPFTPETAKAMEESHAL